MSDVLGGHRPDDCFEEHERRTTAAAPRENDTVTPRLALYVAVAAITGVLLTLTAVVARDGGDKSAIRPFGPDLGSRCFYTNPYQAVCVV